MKKTNMAALILSIIILVSNLGFTVNANDDSVDVSTEITSEDQAELTSEESLELVESADGHNTEDSNSDSIDVGSEEHIDDVNADSTLNDSETTDSDDMIISAQIANELYTQSVPQISTFDSNSHWKTAEYEGKCINYDMTIDFVWVDANKARFTMSYAITAKQDLYKADFCFYPPTGSSIVSYSLGSLSKNSVSVSFQKTLTAGESFTFEYVFEKEVIGSGITAFSLMMSVIPRDPDTGKQLLTFDAPGYTYAFFTPQIQLTDDANGYVSVGDTFTYTINLSSVNSVIGDSLMVTGTIDPNLAIVSYSSGVSVNGNEVTINDVGTGSWEETIAVKVMDTAIVDEEIDSTVYIVYKYDTSMIFSQSSVSDLVAESDAYTITYNGNGNTGGAAPIDSTRYSDGYTATVLYHDSLEKEGYVFTKWNTKADGSGTSYSEGQPIVVEKNIILYAQWEDIPETKYNLTVQTGTGGSVDTTVNGKYLEGDVITLTATPSSSYSFTGWTSNNGGTFANSGSRVTTFTMPAGNVVVIATFTSTGGNSNGGDNNSTDDNNTTDDNNSGDNNNTDDNNSGEINLTTNDETPLGVSDILNTDEHLVYINGYPDGTVRADSNITRAESAQIFYNLLRTQGTADGSYSDVVDNKWYAQAVNYLTSIGILSGYPDGTFRPDEPITRAEFATMASKFDSLTETDSNTFSDVPDNHWAISYINSAYAKGWVNGYPDGTFRPDGNITRSEVVTIVNSMLDRKADANALEEVANPYTDISNEHWAYAEIIEASVEHEYTWGEDNNEIWQSW